MKYYDLRDIAIPQGDINTVEKYLDTFVDYDEYDLNELLGVAVYHKNNNVIAMLNLFIREHNVPTTKMGILRGI